MRANIPASVVVAGHPRYARLMEVKNELIELGGGLKKIAFEIPDLLREAIDIVIDTPRTGRRMYEELEKTEKTYIGTRVEILVRSFFRLPKGKLDLSIMGEDADVKFTTKDNWMIPREAVGKLCLGIAADEQRSKCYFGLFYADEPYLTAGGNQDKKRQLSSVGFANIMWIFCNHPLKPNFWRTISPDVAERVSRQPSGNARVMALFREVQDRPISRDVVEATARQKDFMRRIRADNGKGARDQLAREGILLLSGAYDGKIIDSLGMQPVERNEFVSHRVTPLSLEKLAGFALPKTLSCAG